MKLLVALSIAIAFAIAAPSQVAGLDLCDYAELPSQLGDLVEPAFKCQTASGYSFVTPSTLPTTEELSKICAKCTDLITAALTKGSKLPACQLVLDSGSAVTVDNFFQGIASKCANKNASKNASTSSGSSSASASASASAGVVPVIPIITTAPSSSPPATTAPSPGSASTSTKSPGKGPADQPFDSTDSDDGNGASRPEDRTETDDSTSDDGFMPGTAHSSPATDTASAADQPSSGGSTAKSKTTSPTAALTRTSSAMTTSTASVAVALLASSVAVLSL